MKMVRITNSFIIHMFIPAMIYTLWTSTFLRLVGIVMVRLLDIQRPSYILMEVAIGEGCRIPSMAYRIFDHIPTTALTNTDIRCL